MLKAWLYAQGVSWFELDKQECLLAAGFGRPVRVPVYAQMPEHARRLAGVPASTFYTDAQVFAQVITAVTDYYDFDVLAPIYDVYNLEAEALGQPLVYLPDDIPCVDVDHPLIEKPADLLRLKPPHPQRDGRMPYALEIYDLCAHLSDNLPTALCTGPFSLAVNVRGYANLIMDMHTQPDFVHDLFTFLVDEVLVPWVNTLNRERPGGYLARLLGVHAMDAWASLPNVTPAMYEEYVIEYGRRLRRACPNVHLNSHWGERFLKDKEPGPEYWMGLKMKTQPDRFPYSLASYLFAADPDVAELGPERFAAVARRHQALLMLGLSAPFIRQGPPERIVDRVRHYLRLAAPEGKLTMFINEIPADTPSEHVHAFVKAAHLYGQYPIAEDLETIRLDLSPQPSFAEFEKKSRR